MSEGEHQPSSIVFGIKVDQYNLIRHLFMLSNEVRSQSLASYPDLLLTPVFVACSTNAGEGLVKLSHVQ